jgi:hypothetical protein
MVVPLAGRAAAAVVGGLLVLTAWYSVTATLIVPRSIRNWLTRMVDHVVNKAFLLATSGIAEYQRRDRVLAAQAAEVLLGQVVVWLGISFIGFALLLWPFVTDIARGFTIAASSMFTLGFAAPSGPAPVALVLAAAATGLVVITLQIAYLPVLYASFNRRETEVALLNARAGVPSWGPELLARTHYALGTGVSSVNTLPDLYAQWERWAADIAESHTTYLPLVRFRSPRPMSSWVTALLAVLDSAALYLALSPEAAPVVPARLCLRSGFLCFGQIARAMGIEVPEEQGGDPHISLTYEEFLDGIATMRKVAFPIERDPAEAWSDFAGWRVTYEQAAYAVAEAVDAVPALWSGPRRHHDAPIPPRRPPPGRPPGSSASGRRRAKAPDGAPTRHSAPFAHRPRASAARAPAHGAAQPERTEDDEQHHGDPEQKVQRGDHRRTDHEQDEPGQQDHDQ